MPSLLFDLIISFIQLGLPMLALSWSMFAWLYAQGDLDRDADEKSTKSKLKNLKNSFKDKEQTPSNKRARYVYGQWATFGGGFYGLAALWTFAVIEVVQLFEFIFDFPGFVELFRNGVFSLVFEIVVNQLSNIVSAFVWFGFWSADSVFVTVAVAYLGYRLGVSLAKQGREIPYQPWLDKLMEKIRK